MLRIHKVNAFNLALAKAVYLRRTHTLFLSLPNCHTCFKIICKYNVKRTIKITEYVLEKAPLNEIIHLTLSNLQRQ